MLLVDASQGIQAQTLANCYQALEHDLEIVAALNKIDLPAADPERYAAEIERVLGHPGRGRSCASRPRPARGCTSSSTPSSSGCPPPGGDRDGPAAGPHLRLLLRPVPGGGELDPGHRRRPAHGDRRLRFMQAGVGPRGRGDRRPHARARRRSTSSAPARWATSSPASRTWARPGPARRSPTPSGPAAEPLAGYRDPKPMVFCGLYPIDGDELPDAARRAREAQAQRRELHLRARVLPRARLRLPLRVPRPAAHGDRPGAPRARVRPLADRHRAVGRLPGAPHRRDRAATSTTRASCPTPAGSTTSTSPC